jgi:hypothetical protein
MSQAEQALPSLLAVLATIPDPRKARGKRHPLPAILALACAAMLCGCDSLLAIAEWGRAQGSEVAGRLGFTRTRTPCVATFHRVFRQVERAQFEAVVGQWAEEVCTVLGERGRLVGLAIDGKTVRGSGQPDVPAVHLLSAMSQALGIVVRQQHVGAKTNEIGVLDAFLAELVLTDRVVTVDALLTQRAAATQILAKGGPT